MISKDVWNNTLTPSQRRKVISYLFPNMSSDFIDEWSQKITTKMTDRHKSILKAVKQPKNSRRYEITVIYTL